MVDGVHPVPRNPADSHPDRAAYLGPSVFLVLGILVTAQVLVHATPGAPLVGPVRWLSHAGKELVLPFTVLALALLVVPASWVFTRRWPAFAKAWSRRILDIVLAVAVVATGWMFFSGELVRSRSVPRGVDGFIYGLGSKYYPELGYFDLNRCAVLAAPRRLIPDHTRVRDLRTYRKVRAREIRATAEDCRERGFDDARWADFQADVASFDGAPFGYRGLVRKVVSDKGMNGPPLQVMISSTLARTFWRDYRSVCLLTLIDVWALCLAFGAAARLLGWRSTALLAMAVFTCCVDRYFVQGGSLCRYLWLASAVVGFAGLGAGRWRVAGAFLTLCAALAAFPAVFVIGTTIALVGGSLRARCITADLREFVGASALTAALALLLPLVYADGFGNYSAFFANMAVHTGPIDRGPGKVPLEHFQGYGVGLKWAWAYRGIHFTAKNPVVGLSRAFQEIAWLYRLVGVGLTVLAAAIAWRQPPSAAAFGFGFTAFFCLFGGAGYYFATSVLGLVYLWSRREDPRTALFALALLAVSSIAWVFIARGGHVFVMHRTVCSGLWLIWLLAYLGWQARSVGLGDAVVTALAAPSAPTELNPPTPP